MYWLIEREGAGRQTEAEQKEIAREFEGKFNIKDLTVQGERDLKINLFKRGGQRQWNEIHDINIDMVIDVQQQQKKKNYVLIQSSQIEMHCRKNEYNNLGHSPPS